MSAARTTIWRRGLARCLGVWAITVLAGWLHAAAGADPALFEEANRLYEQGQYRPAADAYQRILAQGRASSAVYFNLGNARFKAGDLGQALVNYRLAERLAPRDPDIQANLRFVREAVRGTPDTKPGWLRRQLQRFSLNEWALGFALALWSGFALLAGAELSPARRASWRRGGLVALGLALLAGGGLAGAWVNRQEPGGAIVITREAQVRRGPLEASPVLQSVGDGTELEILDRKDGWLNVGGLTRGNGWIQATNVFELPN